MYNKNKKRNLIDIIQQHQHQNKLFNGIADDDDNDDGERTKKRKKDKNKNKKSKNDRYQGEDELIINQEEYQGDSDSMFPIKIEENSDQFSAVDNSQANDDYVESVNGIFIYIYIYVLCLFG